MFALILDNKVVDVSGKRFPTTKNMQWIECDDRVKIGFFYMNNEFKPSLKSDSDFLAEVKKEKISQIKSIRDQKNIEPITDFEAFLFDDEGNKTTQQSYFVFYTNRHQTNPASDPDSIISRALDLGSMPYFTKDLSGKKIAVGLTSETATLLRQRIAQRNNNNYKLSTTIEAEINNATTIEEVEAIALGA